MLCGRTLFIPSMPMRRRGLPPEARGCALVSKAFYFRLTNKRSAATCIHAQTQNLEEIAQELRKSFDSERLDKFLARGTHRPMLSGCVGIVSLCAPACSQ